MQGARVDKMGTNAKNTTLMKNKKKDKYFSWGHSYPMKTKGEEHETLSMMSQWEGVLPIMVMDGSEEQKMDKFIHNFVDAQCQLKQTEPKLSPAECCQESNEWVEERLWA